jgi:hypothetical protein
MRRTRHIVSLLLLVAAVAPLAACGGDDGDSTGKTQLAKEGDRKGAESTVRDYLRALVDKDGAAACSKLTSEYQRSVVKQNAAFAKAKGIDTCEELIDTLTHGAPSVLFEGQRLTKQNVDTVKLVVTVRQGGEEQNATVTGAQGLQRYQLVTSKGKWLISEVERG